MKLGFVSAILGNDDFETMIDKASDLGYECVEVCCWPKGKAERRYAGVSHIDVDTLDQKKIDDIKAYCEKKKVEISSLGYYPNPLDRDEEKSTVAIEHIKKLILAAKKLGVGMITTFIGRDQYRSVEENLVDFQKVWTPIIRLAEENQVKVAIENCPMLFGVDQWPGGQNLMTTPALWRKMFDLIPSPNFGLNYDPSHFIWQRIDYIAPLYTFRDKIFHVHVKDIKVYEEKLNQVGIMAYPLEYMSPKLPGLGDVDWGKYISALTDIGYDSYVCIEVEDKAFESSEQRIMKSLMLSKKFMEQFVI